MQKSNKKLKATVLIIHYHAQVHPKVQMKAVSIQRGGCKPISIFLNFALILILILSIEFMIQDSE
jgi:hypothetical protein